ncbi:MAG: hypothetical protein IKK69_08370 [Firmicutes bacterium]|nr:hypothetical protein [Bacillota bacterium]
MGEYIITFIFWFVGSWGTLMVAGPFLDNIYVLILLFSLIAALATVAYGKLSERLTNMERSIEELKEMLKDTEKTEN